MAKITREEFISSLKEMTVLEVLDLVNAMKEELGIDPSVVAAAAAPAEVVTEEGPTSATVVITNAGANKIQVIKAIRDITGLGLKEAKDIADAGGNVKENVEISEANDIKAKLEEAGATVELK